MKPHSLNDREEELDVFFGIINRYIGYFTRDSIKETKNDTTCEYPSVPMDTRQAYEQILLAKNTLEDQQLWRPGLTFLDIGCGIGNIMLLAELLDFTIRGIEKDEYPFMIAKKLLGEEVVAQTDIWDFTGYAEFDVIYYFRPFSEKVLQTKFEAMIEDKLKVGGILIANRKMAMTIDQDQRFNRLNKFLPVWQKK